MKVISGKYKGRVLEGFEIEGTRPTMDRVKESLFSILQEKIPNSVVLDLFSGSGNLAIEALSEGASFAYAVDHNKIAINTIKKNVEKINIENIEIIKSDYQKALDYLERKNIKLDIVFLDPPYKTNYIEQSIKKIDEKELIKEKGWIICESDNKDKIIYSDSYRIIKEKKYGDKYIVIIEKM